MRLAVGGAHWCGKSTLIGDLVAIFKRYSVVEEPYALLADEGYELAHPPSVEDYVAQLECSLTLLENPATDVIFDRCPVDFLGYLAAVDRSYDADEWIDRVRDAMQTIDLVVFVPVEIPERIHVPASEDRRLRSRVDARLRTLYLDDPLDLDVDVLEVEGARQQRAELVVSALASHLARIHA